MSAKWYVIPRQTFTRPAHEVRFSFNAILTDAHVHDTVVPYPAKTFEGGIRAFKFNTKRDALYFVQANPSEPWIIERSA
jgi:hypothetical protein